MRLILTTNYETGMSEQVRYERMRTHSKVAMRSERTAAVGGRHHNDQAVLECLRVATTHPTAAELYEDVRRRYPRIGRATVYRALARLEAVGLIRTVGRDEQGQHYDARTERHDHIVCVACGHVADLATDGDPIPAASFQALAAAAQRLGQDVTSYEIRLYGRCAACAKDSVEKSEVSHE
jgi:Fe2+ or Zn2+ uptake regulation protein